MKLHQLIPTTTRSKKRLGRGIGTGRGKTGGRGTKGAKARGKIPLGFIGGTLPLYKKLPLRRGLGNPKVSVKMLPINVSSLAVLKPNSKVDIEILIQSGIVKEKEIRKVGVKIVGNGDLNIPLTVAVPISKSAAAVIDKAGGKVILQLKDHPERSRRI